MTKPDGQNATPDAPDFIEKAPSDERVALSYPQDRYWLLNLMEPGNTAYNTVAGLRLRGPLDRERLVEAIGDIEARHEALRTFVGLADDATYLAVRPASEPRAELKVVDVADGADSERAAGAAIEAARDRAFDLTAAPPVRWILVRLGEDDHLLAIVVHKILADEHSLEIVLRDLGQAYSQTRRFSGGGGELPLQFRDFARWQCALSHGDGFQRLVDYWTTTLGGELPILELQTDFPRPARTAYQAHRVPFQLDPGTTAGLAAFAEQDVFTVFTAALMLVLRRYSGQTELLLGSPSLNRVRPEVKNLVGRFETMLPLRVDMASAGTFRELLTVVAQVVNDAHEHQELPFERLLEAVNPPRDLSRHPLFQVVVQNESELRLRSEFEGLEVLPLPDAARPPTVMFDLHFAIRLDTAGLEGVCTYSTALFRDDTAARLVSHLQQVLASVAADPDQPLERIELLTDDERRTLLEELNATAHPFPDTMLVHQLVEAQVERSPDRVAVRCGDQSISYRELNARANQVARHLQALGLKPEDRVGICLPRSLEMMIGILATLKAGGVYVPIDPSYPGERQAFMIEDADIFALLTKTELLEQIPQTVPSVVLDASPSPLDDFADTNLEPSQAKLLYMIFTSGSTGRPKGSLVYHRGFVNLINWYVEEFGFDVSSCFLVFSSLSFDLTQKNLFAPLVSGGQLLLLDTPHYDPGRILDLAGRYSATLTNCTPSAFYGLLTNTSPESLSKLSTLKQVVLGGESISTARLKPWTDSRFFNAVVVNSYGPTECTDVVAFHRVEPITGYGASVPVGRPIDNVELYVLDEKLNLVPFGVPGELCIGGVCVGAGYVKRPELNQEKFVAHPFSATEGARIYRTGDRVRYLSDGTIDFLGRIDHQVKLRGYRIELGEITAALENVEEVREAYVMVRNDAQGEAYLAAYVVVSGAEGRDPTVELRKALGRGLPDYMVPTSWVLLERLPMTPNGKVDRSRLPDPAEARAPAAEAEPRGPAAPAAVPAGAGPLSMAEDHIAARWCQLLQRDEVKRQQRFFDLGGTSLKAIHFIGWLSQELGVSIPMVALFQAPTVAELVQYLHRNYTEAFAARYGQVEVASDQTEDRAVAAAGRFRERLGGLDADGFDIAIIGMACRLPGASDLDEFWEMLRDGREAIRRLSDQELLQAGVDPQSIADPDYVKVAAIMDDVEGFDAKFFGMLPREVELMDPQHRVILECAYSVLQHAGYAPEAVPGRVGVFAGVARDAYLTSNLLSHADLMQSAGQYAMMIGNEKDFPATRIAYRFNLTGPAINVQTACSSSGVGLHLAVQSLLLDECDIALVGGCRVLVPATGYLYVDGGTLSPDGHVRAFDAKARGMVRGSGVGFVALKRLDRARADGDTIYAVVKGTAVNNDGAAKVGYTAPSVNGQAAVIRSALARAQVNPDTISYIETHGTGTSLGDPIEIAALTDAYRSFTRRKGYCAIGSVKTNIGHLDAGSSVVGLIKTVLSLQHAQLPPSLHFETPNPQIDFENSPFYVNASLKPWAVDAGPRRAGVSSFGLGGTNTHVILEEAPTQSSGSGKPTELLLLSAKTETALSEAALRLATHLERHSELELADVAYTLETGRSAFEHRRAVVADDREAAIAALRAAPGNLAGRAAAEPPKVVFMFPGQGSQHVQMGRALYETEPQFRESVDRCCEVLVEHLNVDLRPVMFPEPGNETKATEELNQTGLAQPALFVISYGVAQLLLAWGVTPTALVGHSLGEYVAACLAGVFSLNDALRVLASRAQLMQSMPSGCMRAVRLGESELRPLLGHGVSVAAVNAPGISVVSGSHEAIAAFDQQLAQRGIASGVLHTSHAFHSEMMRPMLEPFTEVVSSVQRGTPSIPIMSTLLGAELSAHDAQDPVYWARQVMEPVRFSAAVTALLQKYEGSILLEVGSGTTLSSAARLHLSKPEAARVISTLPHPHDSQPATRTVATALGRLWLSGVNVDFDKWRADGQRRRVGLPSYPFERTRYWVEPARFDAKTVTATPSGSATPASTNSPTVSSGGSDIEQVFADQLRLMQLQLQLLGATGGNSPTGDS